MNRQDGSIVATAILWSAALVAMVVLLKGTEYALPALTIIASAGAVNILIVATRKPRET
jgi:hypothetical protein